MNLYLYMKPAEFLRSFIYRCDWCESSVTYVALKTGESGEADVKVSCRIIGYSSW